MKKTYKKPQINIPKLLNYYHKTAEHDLETVESLWRTKRYDACLFFCHLVLEKMLKGIVTKETKTHPPYTHHLLDLIRKTSFHTQLTKEQWKILSDINEFNVAGRYPDIKLRFYKKCTKEYSEFYYKFTKKFYPWIKQHLLKK